MKYIFSSKNRALLSELVRTDFKLRYQNSILGYSWSLLRPLMLFLILYIVFARFLRLGADIPHFPIYLLLGIVLWNFFTEMTTASLGSIVNRGDLIRKIRIPRWIIVLSSSMSALINLGLNMIVVIIFMFINRVDFMATAPLFLLVILQVYLFALGMSLFLSAAFVKYRDITYIWEVGLQGFFYLTPIIYSVGFISNELLLKLMFLNPMAQAIQDARYALVTHQTITASQIYGGDILRLVPYAITVVAVIVGVLYFKAESKYFGENI